MVRMLRSGADVRNPAGRPGSAGRGDREAGLRDGALWGGLVQQPMAYRRSLSGMVLSPVQYFWNIETRG